VKSALDLLAAGHFRRWKQLAVALFAMLAAPAAAQQAAQLQITTPYAILVDYESGTVLYEKGADTPWPPASLAKLMTMELVYKEIQEGRLNLDDMLTVSEYAWRKGGAPSGGSSMYASIHSKVKVSDLIQGVVVVSGNDACIVFAEAIAGNESAFATKMTERARELGLTTADFRNAPGLHDPDQKISVRDLAKLAMHIIRTYPEFMKYYSQPEFTWNNIRQQNRNPLLAMGLGADGMKTGFIKESGYGLVGTAVQGGHRLVLAMNGAKSIKERADEARKLLEWGFRAFDSRLLFAEGRTVSEARVFGGERSRVAVVGQRPIRLLVPRGTADKLVVRMVYQGPLRAPVKKGAEVARLKVWRAEKVALDAPLVAADDVAEGGIARRAFDGAYEIALDLVRTGLSSIKRN
jgi:serine-type D-Ala-D-Ala carboxypeptidase (penicillin-binding protein 5/6)